MLTYLKKSPIGNSLLIAYFTSNLPIVFGIMYYSGGDGLGLFLYLMFISTIVFIIVGLVSYFLLRINIGLVSTESTSVEIKYEAVVAVLIGGLSLLDMISESYLHYGSPTFMLSISLFPALVITRNWSIKKKLIFILPWVFVYNLAGYIKPCISVAHYYLKPHSTCSTFMDLF